MAEAHVTTDAAARILDSLHSTCPVRGLTHNFYRYPARMSPDLARELIRHFTHPQDVVLDPFLGGGTTVVEAVAMGRRAVGVDINPVATFVTAAKTTPMSNADRSVVAQWARDVAVALECPGTDKVVHHDDPRIKNLPQSLVPFFDRALQRVSELRFPRQQQFARCALLRLGQWAVDGRHTTLAPSAVREALPDLVYEMLSGVEQFVTTAREHDVDKHRLTGQRLLLLRSVVGLDRDRRVQNPLLRPTLVLTSPPYPAVHVLYHRWQVHGRRETPAPYWFVGAPDGRGASYYTLGSRTPFGLNNYFHSLTASYQSIRALIAPTALVAQLVAFSDVASQLPLFLAAMETAGFQDVAPITESRADLWRTIPNRNWYYRVGATRGSKRELLLFHRPV